MQISHGARIVTPHDRNGFGVATRAMLSSLAQLGHTVKPNDPTAPVEIWFDQVQHVVWTNPDAYKILYLPWESTELLDGWLKIMNTADEVWTPSDVVAGWFADCGVEVPIFVYNHGVDKIWKPKPRIVEDKISFFHVGSEAARRCGHETMNALRRAFPDRQDVGLTLKIISSAWKIPNVGRIQIVNESLDVEKLVELYQQNHIMIGISYGEGFGLSPLQALATGMPVINMPEWAPYRHLFDPRLSIDSTLRRSPWHNTVHPGKMFRPNFDDLVDKMKFAVDNYESIHTFAQEKAGRVAEEYDWNTLTKQAFESLENRLPE